MLTVKLEEFVEKAKQRKSEKASSLIRQTEQDDVIREKEQELKATQNKIQFYKKEIAAMRR